MATDRSTSPHSYDILTPVVTQYSRSKPPELTFTSDFLRRCRNIVVARFSTSGEGILGSSRWSWQRGNARWNLAGSERPDWSIMYIDVALDSCRIAVA